MTQNQINYWKNVETERANRAREEIDKRAQMSKSKLDEEQARLAKYNTLGSVVGALTSKYAPATVRAATAAIVGKELGIGDQYVGGGKVSTTGSQSAKAIGKQASESTRKSRKAYSDIVSGRKASTPGGGKGTSGGGMGSRR